MGHPKRSRGRYTAPKSKGDGHSPVDLELPGVTANLPKSGMVQLPVEFLDWLDREGLVDEFDDHWHQCIIDSVHGDALTAFASVHEAPGVVLDSIRSFG